MRRPVVEFSRPVEVARLPTGGSVEIIEATSEECKAVARRLQLPAVAVLSAKLTAEPWRNGGAKVTGALHAEIEQVCVVTLEGFATTVREPVERYFIPPGIAQGVSDEDETDVVENGVIDLGELVTETLALALDLYPRKPGVVFEAPGDDAQAGDSPFARLQQPERRDG